MVQAVFELSLQDGDLDSAPYLRPMSSDPNIQACFAALAAEVPNFCAEDPGIALRYLLRGPGSVSLYSYARPHLDAKDTSLSPDNVARFTSYVGVGRREDSLDWARRATAVIAQPFISNSKPRVVAPGVVGLRRKKRENEVTISTAIESLINSNVVKRESKESSRVKTPLVFAFTIVNVVSVTSSRSYGSIYVILGLIEKILSLASKDLNVTKTVFYRAYPSLTISAPSWSLNGNVDNEVDQSDQMGVGTNGLNNHKDDLWIKVKKWLDDVSMDLFNNILPSGIFLGKVWTRIYFSLQNASDELKSEKFGTIMEIFALCVLNAFLVEESEHHMISSGTPVKVSRTNPRSSAKYFVQKLNTVKHQRNQFPFTAIMATCPLILGLLNENEGYAKSLQSLFPKDFGEENITALLCPNDIFTEFQKVSIAGGKPLENADPDGKGNSSEPKKTD